MTSSSSSDRVSVAFLILILGSLTVARGQVQQQQCAGVGEYCQNHWDCCSNTCMSYLYRCTRNYGIYPFTFGGVYPPVQSTLDEILELNFGNNIRAPVEVQIRPVAFYPRFGGVDEFNSDFVVVERDLQKTTTPTTTEKPVKCQAEAGAAIVEAKKEDAIISAAKTAITTATEKEDDDIKISTEDVKRSLIITTTPTTPEPTTKTPETTTKAPEPTTKTPEPTTKAPEPPTKTPEPTTGTPETPELASVTSTRTGTTTTTTSPSTTSTPSTRCSAVGSKCYRHEECCTVRCHGFLHQCVT